jgi:hypothetical protein
MKTDQTELETLYPKMPSIPSDIEISQNAAMKPILEIAAFCEISISEGMLGILG